MPGKRRSILVSYRVSEHDDLDAPENDKEIAVFNETISAAFERLLKDSPLFNQETINGVVKKSRLLTGDMVRSPENGQTLRQHFMAIENQDWEMLRQTCIPDLAYHCDRHNHTCNNFEEYLEHIRQPREQFSEVKFTFPGMVSIGTRHAIFQYTYNFDNGHPPYSVKFSAGEYKDWGYVEFNKDRLITRISRRAEASRRGASPTFSPSSDGINGFPWDYDKLAA